MTLIDIEHLDNGCVCVLCESMLCWFTAVLSWIYAWVVKERALPTDITSHTFLIFQSSIRMLLPVDQPCTRRRMR